MLTIFLHFFLNIILIPWMQLMRSDLTSK